MKLLNRIYGLLALLVMGSASLQAQDSDPFGEINPRLYQGNMSITAQVVQNGDVVTTAVVAAYYGEELRGKDFVGNDANNPGLVYLSVFGNSGNYNQSLHFKVYTDGRVFSFYPDPVINWKNNDIIGSTAYPYIITLPLSLANDADNTETLTAFANQTCDVILTGRTLFKDGKWNTICLPFNVTIAGSDLDGATALPLNAASITGSTLNLTFGDAVTTLTAGTPYIIKWDGGTDITDPLFTNVTIDMTDRSFDNEATGELRVRFKGTNKMTTFDATDMSILLMGEENTLYYPLKGAGIGSQHAYFKLGDGTALTRQMTAFNIDFGNVTTVTNGVRCQTEDVRGGWYTLDGRQLNGTPMQHGVYVRNGKKMVVK